MNNIRLVAVDDSESFLSSISEYFRSHAVIDVVKKFTSSEESLNYLLNKSNEYDLILLDLIMPGKDGVYILEELKKHNINKKVIVTSSYENELLMKSIAFYKVDYYYLKPLSLVSLERRIIDIFKQKDKMVTKNKDLQCVITDVLHSLGMPSHIKGYQYIRESIYLMYNEPNYMGSITKALYPEVANRFQTTSTRVERAIRHAIEVSWTRGDYEMMENYFGNSVDFEKSKPTNSEFISTVADRLRLNDYKFTI